MKIVKKYRIRLSKIESLVICRVTTADYSKFYQFCNKPTEFIADGIKAKSSTVSRKKWSKVQNVSYIIRVALFQRCFEFYSAAECRGTTGARKLLDPHLPLPFFALKRITRLG